MNTKVTTLCLRPCCDQIGHYSAGLPRDMLARRAIRSDPDSAIGCNTIRAKRFRARIQAR